MFNSTHNLAKLSTVLFDLDNTLIDTRAADFEAIQDVMHYLKHHACIEKKRTRKALRDFYQAVEMEAVEESAISEMDVDIRRQVQWSQAFGPKLNCTQIEESYYVWKKARLQALQMNHDVERVLGELRYRGFKVAILTNGDEKVQREKIHRVGLQALVDAVIIGGEYGFSKPDPQIFEVAFRYLGVSSTDCAMVGDTLATDIEGGRRARVGATFWLTPRHNKKSEIYQEVTPDYEITQIAQLLNYLQQCKPQTFWFETTANQMSVVRPGATWWQWF